MCSPAAKEAGLGRPAVVVGPGMDDVAAAATALDPKLEIFVQAEQLGTADAVKAARPAVEAFSGQVLDALRRYAVAHAPRRSARSAPSSRRAPISW